MPRSHWQYQGLAEPVLVPSAAESITPDKWLGSYPVVARRAPALSTALNAVACVFVSVFLGPLPDTTYPSRIDPVAPRVGSALTITNAAFVSLLPTAGDYADPCLTTHANIYRVEAFVFPNAADRVASTRYVISLDDVGKWAYQQDTGQYWRLMSVTDAGPVWGLVAQVT